METLYRGFTWGLTGQKQNMLVRDGKVVYRGKATIDSPSANVQDKSGWTLFPKYIDNHCHILPTGLDLGKLNLSGTTSHEEVLDLLRERVLSHQEGWLLAVHYDQNRYEGRHLTRAALDKLSSTRPILLRHSSGHAGVANSLALEMAGVEPNVQDEQGGSYGRDESGELNGVLFENAFERVTKAIPLPTKDQMVEAILAAADSMDSLDISCASDMQTGSFRLEDELEAYRIASEHAKISMRLYLQWGRVFGPRSPSRERMKELVDSFDGARCRVQGVKLFADGAIGAGTAAIYGSYADAPSENSNSGTLMYRPEVLKQRIRQASDTGWQVSVHAIGDHAADIVMEAFDETGCAERHRIEHAMLLDDGGIDRLARVGCFVCLQPEFLQRFGQTYRAKLGPERCATLVRAHSLMEAGLRVSFSSDRPITAGEPETGIKLATCRPEGFSQSENCTLEQALGAYTSAAALATGDEGLAGTLEPGTLAECRWTPPSLELQTVL